MWVDHFRAPDEKLAALLENDETMIHPFVVGELALGKFRNRDHILHFLNNLPKAQVSKEREVLHLIDRLFGRGIGYVDPHLLAAMRLTLGFRHGRGISAWPRRQPNSHSCRSSTERLPGRPSDTSAGRS